VGDGAAISPVPLAGRGAFVASPRPEGRRPRSAATEYLPAGV